MDILQFKTVKSLQEYTKKIMKSNKQKRNFKTFYEPCKDIIDWMFIKWNKKMFQKLNLKNFSNKNESCDKFITTIKGRKTKDKGKIYGHNKRNIRFCPNSIVKSHKSKLKKLPILDNTQSESILLSNDNIGISKIEEKFCGQLLTESSDMPQLTSLFKEEEWTPLKKENIRMVKLCGKFCSKLLTESLNLPQLTHPCNENECECIYQPSTFRMTDFQPPYDLDQTPYINAPVITANCGNASCNLGCICSSLKNKNDTFKRSIHCRKIECMFNCKCNFMPDNFADKLQDIFSLNTELHLNLRKPKRYFVGPKIVNKLLKNSTQDNRTISYNDKNFKKNNICNGLDETEINILNIENQNITKLNKQVKLKKRKIQRKFEFKKNEINDSKPESPLKKVEISPKKSEQHVEIVISSSDEEDVQITHSHFYDSNNCVNSKTDKEKMNSKEDYSLDKIDSNLVQKTSPDSVKIISQNTKVSLLSKLSKIEIYPSYMTSTLRVSRNNSILYSYKQLAISLITNFNWQLFKNEILQQVFKFVEANKCYRFLLFNNKIECKIIPKFNNIDDPKKIELVLTYLDKAPNCLITSKSPPIEIIDDDELDTSISSCQKSNKCFNRNHKWNPNIDRISILKKPSPIKKSINDSNETDKTIIQCQQSNNVINRIPQPNPNLSYISILKRPCSIEKNNNQDSEYNNSSVKKPYESSLKDLIVQDNMNGHISNGKFVTLKILPSDLHNITNATQENQSSKHFFSFCNNLNIDNSNEVLKTSISHNDSKINIDINVDNHLVPLLNDSKSETINIDIDSLDDSFDDIICTDKDEYQISNYDNNNLPSQNKIFKKIDPMDNNKSITILSPRNISLANLSHIDLIDSEQSIDQINKIENPIVATDLNRNHYTSDSNYTLHSINKTTPIQFKRIFKKPIIISDPNKFKLKFIKEPKTVENTRLIFKKDNRSIILKNNIEFKNNLNNNQSPSTDEDTKSNLPIKANGHDYYQDKDEEINKSPKSYINKSIFNDFKDKNQTDNKILNIYPKILPKVFLQNKGNQIIFKLNDKNRLINTCSIPIYTSNYKNTNIGSEINNGTSAVKEVNNSNPIINNTHFISKANLFNESVRFKLVSVMKKDTTY